MSKNPQPVPRTSRLAIASLILAILGPLTLGLTFLPGFVLGLVAHSSIINDRRLKGKGLAIAGTVLSGILMTPFFLYAVTISRMPDNQSMAESNLKVISNGMQYYIQDNGDRYPAADNWADTLVEHTEISPRSFVWPAKKKEGRMWAMNAALDNAFSGVPASTVVLFECAPGSPMAGGPELLPAAPRGRLGYIIMFADMSVQIVPPDQIETLLWEPRGRLLRRGHPGAEPGLDAQHKKGHDR